MSTGGRVTAAGYVVPESAPTGSRVVGAGGVHQEGSTTSGRVLAATRVAEEGAGSFCRVVASVVVIECLKTKARVPFAGCVVKQSVSPLSGVAPGIASIRSWGREKCLRCR